MLPMRFWWSYVPAAREVPVMEEIPDMADPAATSRRGSNKVWPNTGKVQNGFNSPGSSEVHGITAMHKILAHGGRCQIRWIHDMETTLLSNYSQADTIKR